MWVATPISKKERAQSHGTQRTVRNDIEAFLVPARYRDVTHIAVMRDSNGISPGHCHPLIMAAREQLAEVPAEL